MRRLASFAALWAVVAMCALLAQAQVEAPQVKVTPQISVAPKAPALLVSPALIQRTFAAVVAEQDWPQERKRAVLDAFGKLPAGMQQAVAASRDAGLATNLGAVSLRLSRDLIARRPVADLRTPYISTTWPAGGDGAPGSYVLVYGMGLNANCQAWFNGSAHTTRYMPWGEDWGDCVGFQIPAVPIARDYDLYLKDTAADRSGNHVNYRVVAPRGWRGLHGWKFANFGEATMSWDLFRHYFGANEVEDGAGRHLPAAQAWYDSVYKRVGSGGNCFGMTMRAIRTLFWQPWSLFEDWWRGHRLARAWNYDFVNEVRRSVNEDQGAQLEASVMANKLWLLDNQDHNRAWERCRDLIGQLGSRNQPMLSIYGPGWGHCVWPYRTEEAGNERRIYIYDNNVPYAENEASDATMIVRINKTTGSLTWGSATRTICRAYRDCTPADPRLPSEATDGEAAMMVTIVVDRPARATQITDAAGRRFYTDSRVNTDPRTRIPHSALFIPDTGTTPAPDFPWVYLFGRARDGKLQLQLSGMGDRAMRAFAPGLVFEVQSSGDQSNVTLDKLLTSQASLLLAQEHPAQVTAIMRTGPRQQRVIGVRVLDAARGLLFAPKADRSGVNIENRSGAPVRYEIEMQNFAADKVIGVRLPSQTLGAQAGAALTPANWAQLGEVNVEMRNLRTGATIRRDTLRPM